MSTIQPSKFTVTGTIEGLGKKGAVYSFLIGFPTNNVPALVKESSIQVNGVGVAIKDFDGEYLSFELPLERVVDSSLAELQIGSEVSLVIL